MWILCAGVSWVSKLIGNISHCFWRAGHYAVDAISPRALTLAKCRPLLHSAPRYCGRCRRASRRAMCRCGYARLLRPELLVDKWAPCGVDTDFTRSRQLLAGRFDPRCSCACSCRQGRKSHLVALLVRGEVKISMKMSLNETQCKY